MTTRKTAITRTTTTTRAAGSTRSRLRAGAVAAATAAVLTGGVAGVGTPAQAATRGTVYDVSTVAQLNDAVSVLKAGDTVKIEPGVYDLGSWRPRLGTFGHHAVGTAAAPITFTGADPARPPLLRGALKLDGANYWHLSRLRIQGNISTTDTLTFNGGTGWSLMNSEVFGATQTGAFANVVVAKTSPQPMPTNWVIADNSIHGGGRDASKAGKLHEIYLTAVGDARRGLIVRNSLYDTPEGATVKIGSGGLENSPGISGVQVTDNTMFNNFEQVLLHGKVSNNFVEANLMIRSTRHMGDGNTAGVYLAGVTGTHNVIRGNYSYSVTRPIYNNDSTGHFTDGGKNTNGADPRFDSTTLTGFHPRTAAAKAYGRYAPTASWH